MIQTSRAAQALVSTVAPAATPIVAVTDEEAVACSLENPESCEACQ